MLNLANSINRLNLLVQQTKLQEQLQGTEVPKTRIVQGSPQTVFIGDLPKELSLVELYDFLKDKVGDCEVVLKRPTLKYFYYAFCRFPDIIQARRLLNDIKFPELHGKVCRALPYDKELLRSCEPKSNVFVKGFGVRWSHKDLHKAFEQFGPIVSARVSIKDNYESRGYGFVQFTNASSAERACQVMDGKQVTLESQDGNEPESFTLRATVFIPVAERPQAKDQFTNLFVKNFPAKVASDEELKEMFEVFGPVSSCKIDEASKAFGFVCFEKPEDAKSALDHFSKIEGGLQITKALPKSERARQLRLQTLRFMKEIAKQNLYFKGFPVDGSSSVEDLIKELETHFSKCGEIKTLKLMSRTIEVEGLEHEELLGFGFVSFTTLEGSQKARFDGSKELFRGTHKLQVSQFEWKELRQAHRMERMDQAELAQYMKVERTKKANEVLAAVKADLETDQGQLLLRVLKMLTQVNQKKEETRRSKSRANIAQQAQQAAAPADEASGPNQLEKETQVRNQVYAVRMQTLITSQAFSDCDETMKKQQIGTFIFDQVRMFVESVVLQLHLYVPGGPQEGAALAAKVTGMIMSLPLSPLILGVSTIEGLTQKVQEAMALLIKNRVLLQQQ